MRSTIDPSSSKRTGASGSLVVTVAILVIQGMVLATQPTCAATQASAPPDSVRTLISRGQFDDARTLARARLASLSDLGGIDSLRVADEIDLIVETIWRSRGKPPPDASALAERAVRLREQARGPMHLEVASALTNLGRIQRTLQQPESARASYESAPSSNAAGRRRTSRSDACTSRRRSTTRSSRSPTHSVP